MDPNLQQLQLLSDALVQLIPKLTIRHSSNTTVCQEALSVQDYAQALMNSITVNPNTSSVVASQSAYTQTGNVGTVTLFTTPNDGLNHIYRLTVSAEISTTGSGGVTVNMIVTDPYNAPGTPLTVVGANGDPQSGTFTMALEPNSPIQYNVTFSGTGNYWFSVLVEQLQ